MQASNSSERVTYVHASASFASASIPPLFHDGLIAPNLRETSRLMNIQLPAHMDKPSFLAWLQGREGRYELVGGRVLMMTGGTMAHGLIAGNVFQMLRARLDRKTWAVLTEFGVDVGPGSIRYPDVVVVDRRG